MMWDLQFGVATRGLALEVEVETPERTLVVTGPNGSGKTTLLRALVGALTPQTGRIAVDGQVLFDGEAGIDRPMQARGVGYVPQGYALFRHLDVLGNAMFGLPAVLRGAERREAGLHLLERLDVAHLAHRLPDELSGGESQRVALARALGREPGLLVLDEPLAALDLPARRAMRVSLCEWVDQMNVATVVVTHDVRDVEAFGGRLVVLEKGRVVVSGSADEVRATRINDFVCEFFAL